MKITLAQALLSKIRQPLPLNPQDSRKLLHRLNESLQTSLQKQLDAGYPYGLEHSSRHTCDHIQSILGDPLFKAKSSRRRVSPSEFQRKDGDSTQSLQYWIKQPLDAFKQGASTGAATLETAKLCLELQRENRLSPVLRKGNRIPDTASTGATVLSWLWSSGMRESGHHLRDREFISLLVPFLVVEQRYDVVFDWFSRFEQGNFHEAEKGSQKDQLAQSALLQDLVSSERIYGAGLGASMLHFTEYLCRKTTTDASICQRVFRPTGNYLAHRLTRRGRRAIAPEDTLSTFIATSQEWVEKESFENVLLQTYHPKAPQPHMALEYLQRLSTESIESLDSFAKLSLIQTSLKAAKILFENGYESNSRWIMDFMEKNFPEEIGLEDSRRNPSTPTKRNLNKEQDFHLQLLETLRVH